MEPGGHDYGLIGKTSEAVSIPVVTFGGAGSMHDLKRALESGASAATATSSFVFFGKLKGVLLTYPLSPDLTME